MRTARSSSHLLGGGEISASVHAWINPPGLDTPQGVGLDPPVWPGPLRYGSGQTPRCRPGHTPPLGVGLDTPQPDPQPPPWVWAWTPSPGQTPTFPLGLGLDTPLWTEWQTGNNWKIVILESIFHATIVCQKEATRFQYDWLFKVTSLYSSILSPTWTKMSVLLTHPGLIGCPRHEDTRHLFWLCFHENKEKLLGNKSHL